VYCYSIRDPRFDRSSQESSKIVREIVGQSSNVAIVTTHWDDPGSRSYGAQLSRQEQLKEDLLRKWIDKGNEIYQTDDSSTAARDIIRSLLQNQARVRRIREEVEAIGGFEEKAVRKAKEIRKQRLVRVKTSRERLDVEAEIRILNSYEVPSKIHWNIFRR
jgi:hypothetical protein